MKHKTKPFGWILWLGLLLLYSCPPATRLTTEVAFFFSSRNFWETMPFEQVDSAMRKIRTEVPAHWYGRTCEALFFSLPDGVKDSVSLLYLERFESDFPQETVIAFANLMRGSHFIRHAQYDTAYKCLQKCYQLAVKLEHPLRVADTKYELARWHLQQGDYPESIRFLLEVHAVYTQLGRDSYNDGRYFELLMSIGNAYKSFQDFPTAQLWYQTAWDYARQYPWAKGFKILSAAEVADGYLQANRLDSAQIMLDTAFYYQHLYQNTYKQAHRYWIQARIDIARGECQKALQHFQQAIQFNNQEDKNVFCRYNAGLATAYRCMGRWNDAIAFYQKALNTPDSVAQKEIYEQLSVVYSKTNRFELALKSQIRSQELSLNLSNMQKNKAIGLLEAKAGFQQRELKFQQELKQQRINRLIALVVILILVLGLSVALFLSSRQKQEQILLEQQKQLLEKENQAMEQQKLLLQQENQAQEQQKQLLEQEKEVIQAREQLNVLTLEQMERDLNLKTAALEASEKLLDLKTALIDELERKAIVQVPVPDSKDSNIVPSKEQLQFRQMKILTADDWKKFYDLFETTFPNFKFKLKTHFPDLTPAETRLFLLIKMRFDTAEIAETLAISADSVYKGRYRLRKKLGLSEQADWEQFVIDF